MNGIEGIVQKLISFGRTLWHFLEEKTLGDLPRSVQFRSKKWQNPGKKNELGLAGESEAIRFLKKQRYQILHQNMSLPSCEIDLIAWIPNKRILVFIEVKTRCSRDYGEPYEAVDRKRRRKMISAAQEYLQIVRPGEKITIRFDIISIIWPLHDRPQIEHLENAFNAMTDEGMGS